MLLEKSGVLWCATFLLATHPNTLTTSTFTTKNKQIVMYEIFQMLIIFKQFYLAHRLIVLLGVYIWWLQHLHRWLPSQVSYSASNSPSCVLRWLWRPAADLQGWWQTWHTKVKVLTGLIGSAWEILSLCTTIYLFSPDADLHTLLHITHTVLSGRYGTLDDDGLSMWDFIWFTYPAFERRTRLHISYIYIYIYIYIYTNPSGRQGYHTRSILSEV